MKLTRERRGCSREISLFPREGEILCRVRKKGGNETWAHVMAFWGTIRLEGTICLCTMLRGDGDQIAYCWMLRALGVIIYLPLLHLFFKTVH